ncbi:hypothetical protein [Hydrogenovibrio marinus]|uniref:Uncharacterized protein n=1 Tax=Hydrogenovibrio marinus TaxID=28885 RepID=A0A066ZLM2_HYDMR|nr:hypothetical protein [Hydrogenovibrio marinus]KDN94683.1 hypothetical protein EI16_12350 [Hydrogenovibrio marinus]
MTLDEKIARIKKVRSISLGASAFFLLLFILLKTWFLDDFLVPNEVEWLKELILSLYSLAFLVSLFMSTLYTWVYYSLKKEKECSNEQQ